MIEKPYYDGAKVWRLSGALTATLIDNMLGTNGLTKKINQLLKDFNDKYQDSWWNENIGKYVPEATANGMNEVAKFQQEYPEIFYGIMFLQSQLSKSSSMPSTIFDRLLQATVADNINSYMNSGELTGLSYANGYTSAMIAKAIGIPASLMNIGPTASAMGDLLEHPATTLLNIHYNYQDEIFKTAIYGTPQDMSHLMGKTQFEVDMLATEIAAMCFAPKATINMNIGNNAANFINSAAGQMQRILTSTGAVQWVLVPGTVVTAGSTIAVGANVAGSLAALDMASSASGGDDKEKMLGENGPQISSKTTGQNGKTERVDVENSNPGNRPGEIHYHEPDNTKWRYDVKSKQFVDPKTLKPAPPRVQKTLKEVWVQKALKKGIKILGE